MNARDVCLELGVNIEPWQERILDDVLEQRRPRRIEGVIVHHLVLDDFGRWVSTGLWPGLEAWERPLTAESIALIEAGFHADR